MLASRRAAIFALLLAAAGAAILVASLLRRREAGAPAAEGRRAPAWFECEAAPLLDRDYYHALRRVLPRARESIDVLQYLWEWTGDAADAPHRLLDDLAAAAARGVRVRVLLEDRAADESRLTRDHREVLRYLRARGVDARLDDPGRELHDKLVVVDGGETVIVASHSHSRSALLFNHEVGAVVVPTDRAAAAPLLAYVEEVFAEGRDLAVPLGALSGAPAPPPAGGDSTFLVPARGRWVIAADYGPIAQALVARARASIAIGMYYLVPTALVRGHPVDDLLVELRRAAGRGVSIEAVLDEEVQGVGVGANDLGRDLLERLGAVVRFDDPGTVSHGKFMVVDDRYALLGSHNWSASAFRENRETSVLLDAPPIAEALRRYLRETLPRPGPGAPPPPLAPGEKIDLNTAGRRDLMRLPGIAEGLADAILADRAARGPFRSVSDLRRVEGIGPERYRLAAPHVTVSH